MNDNGNATEEPLREITRNLQTLVNHRIITSSLKLLDVGSTVNIVTTQFPETVEEMLGRVKERQT